MVMANTLAYYDTATAMGVRCFIVLVSALKVAKNDRKIIVRNIDHIGPEFYQDWAAL
jgi:hypothetical protein